MVEITLIILYTLLFFSLIFLFIVWKYKKLRKKINDNKPIIETIYIIASFFTVISVFIALTQFYNEQEHTRKLELENQRILLESFDDEINYNLEIVNWTQNNSKKLLETDEWPYFHYSTISLKQVISDGKIGDISLRQQFRRIYSLTDQANTVLDSTPIFIPLTKEQYDIFFKLKKERANSLLDYNNRIKGELLDLQPKIKSLIQSIRT